MGVTGPSLPVAALAVLFAFAPALQAGKSADALATVNYIASALSDDNPTDAMTPFDKSYGDYDKLASYFQGLVDRALITSEVQVVDEKDSENAIDLVVQWTMDLSNRNMTGLTEDRTEELHLHLIKTKAKWKIAGLSPLSFFDPQRSQSK
ncbi:MAG: hypothetical protein WA324_05895 [Bryobacteraceae bacterium]